MRSRWLRHPRWQARLARRTAGRWLRRTFVWRPQCLYAYYWKYRKDENPGRLIKSVYWPHLRTLRTYHSPVMDLFTFKKIPYDVHR